MEPPGASRSASMKGSTSTLMVSEQPKMLVYISSISPSPASEGEKIPKLSFIIPSPEKIPGKAVESTTI